MLGLLLDRQLLALLLVRLLALLLALLLAHLLAQLLLDDDWVQGALGLVLIHSIFPVRVSTESELARGKGMTVLIAFNYSNGQDFNFWSRFQLFGQDFNLPAVEVAACSAVG